MKISKGLGLTIVIVFLMLSCKEKLENKSEIDNLKTMTKLKTTVNPEDFVTLIEGDSVGFYTLKNANGIEITFTNYGQRLVSLHAPDKNGKFEDVVLGFATLKDFMKKRNFFGAVIGRYGNRIGKGTFMIGDTKYDLAINNGENSLHGGLIGFEAVVWRVDEATENSITFSRLSPDMEEGYPGNLDVQVSYILNDSNELIIKYKAISDKATVVNLTNHSFFNLKGEGNGDITDHVMMINADGYTPVDDGLIPTGKIDKVAGTPFDFNTPKTIGKDIDSDFGQLKIGKGYDHNYVLNDTPQNEDGLKLAAKVIEPASGRTLEVYTSEPGMQLYTGNFLTGADIGKTDKVYPFRGSFCLETQHYPDSPNKPEFPSTLLNPGEVYESTTIYKFGVVEE